MPHAAIIGMTESGKTYLAKYLAKMYKSKGYETLALHKPDEPWSNEEVTKQTTDLDLLLDLIETRNEENKHKIENLGFPSQLINGYIVFMELSDANAEKYDSRIHSQFTAGRHKGHMLHYLSQRSAIVHPTIRENCGILYLFNCHSTQAKDWSIEFNDKELLNASKLPVHWFYHKKSRMQPVGLPKKL